MTNPLDNTEQDAADRMTTMASMFRTMATIAYNVQQATAEARDHAEADVKDIETAQANSNTAIGALLTIEHQLQLLQAMYTTALSLHRGGK